MDATQVAAATSRANTYKLTRTGCLHLNHLSSAKADSTERSDSLARERVQSGGICTTLRQGLLCSNPCSDMDSLSWVLVKSQSSFLSLPICNMGIKLSASQKPSDEVVVKWENSPECTQYAPNSYGPQDLLSWKMFELVATSHRPRWYKWPDCYSSLWRDAVRGYKQSSLEVSLEVCILVTYIT